MSDEIPKPAPETEEDMTATLNHAHDFGLPARQEGESAKAFRARISSALRDQGYMIEAHEAWAGKYFDQDDDAITGVMGAVAMGMSDVDFGTHDGKLVGDEIAAGVAAQAPKKDLSMALLAVLLFGGGDNR